MSQENLSRVTEYIQRLSDKASVRFETIKNDFGLTGEDTNKLIQILKKHDLVVYVRTSNEIMPLNNMKIRVEDESFCNELGTEILNAIKINFKIEKDEVFVLKEYIKKQPIYLDESKIWWVWDNDSSSWHMADDIDISNLFYHDAGITEIIKPGSRTKWFHAASIVGRTNKPRDIPSTWIQFKNCVIDIKQNDIVPINISPDYFFTNPIPHNFLRDKKEDELVCPVIDSLFADWVHTGDKEKDEANKQLLYEILAYCMLPDYPIHRMFCLLGAGRNGKSKYRAILRKLIGNKNVTSTDLDALSNINSRFESAKLYRKLVAEIGETNFSILKSTSLIKSLTGQDLIRGEIKNKNPFDFMNYAKLIISTNSLPITLDKTVGFYSRWTIIKFPNQFPEGVDVLSQIPEEEYDILATKCVYILKNILLRGEFVGSDSTDIREQMYEENSNPTLLFIKENFEKDMTSEVIFWQFVDELNVYLKNKGHRILTNKEVSSLLEDQGYETKRKNFYFDGEEKKWTVIFGLKRRDKKDKGVNLDPTKSEFLKRHSVSKKNEENERTLQTQRTTSPYLQYQKLNGEGKYNRSIESVSFESPESPDDSEPKSKAQVVMALYPTKSPPKYIMDLEKEAKNNGIELEDFIDIHEKFKKTGVIMEIKPGHFIRM